MKAIILVIQWFLSWRMMEWWLCNGRSEPYSVSSERIHIINEALSCG